MKIRNEKRLKLRYGICILLFCTALNFVGKYIAGCYQLPVWLDMIGTCVAVSLLGLPYGILVAFLNSFIFTVFYKLEFFYVFTAIVCAVVLDYCTRKSYMEKLSTLLYSMLHCIFYNRFYTSHRHIKIMQLILYNNLEFRNSQLLNL